jgi:hypothetical protein
MPANWYRVNSNGTTVKIKSLHRLNSNGTFAKIKSIFRLNSNGTLAKVFSSILSPSIQTRVEVTASGGLSGSTIMNDSSPITLTSTRYHWLDADGFTYIWQKSANNSTWTNIGTAQSTTNPASGASSSSITRTLSSSDFTSGSDMYFRFVFSATNSTYSTSASSESLPILISYYGTPIPQPGSPSITGSTVVGSTASANIGTWTNSPTSYDYRVYYTSGLSSYPLTYAGVKSVSNKFLSGFSAALVTSASHGYKVNDTVIVSGMDSLFNGSHIITAKTNNTIYLTLPTPTGWSASTSYSVGSLVSYLGDAYYASISMPAPSLFSISSGYSVGDNAWDGFTRYRCIQSISAVSAWSSGSNYATGSIIHYNGTRWQAQQNSGPGYGGAQTPSSGNYLYWSEVNVSLSNASYWQNAYPYNASYWTLQSFSNAVTSGTTTAPNYYEGTVASSTSISVPITTFSYKENIDLRGATTSGSGAVLNFGVKAYNQATLSPSEYFGTAFIYGVPVLSIGSITPVYTTASVPFTSSYVSSYLLNLYTQPSITNVVGGASTVTYSAVNTFTAGQQVVISGINPSQYNGTRTIQSATSTSFTVSANITGAYVSGGTAKVTVSGYPLPVSSNTSPRSITGLSEGTTYYLEMTPANSGTTGTMQTSSFTTLVQPTISGISLTTTPLPSSATGITTSSSSNVGTTSWTNGSNTSFANLSLVTGAGTLAQQNDPTSLTTSGTFAITSSGNANITIRAINASKRVDATWTQTNAQSYSISYDVTGAPGNPQTVTGNSSASNPSAQLLASAGTATLRSITVYPQQNQQGTGVTLTSTLSATAANTTTNTTATNAVTYALLPAYTPTISAATSTSDGFTGQVTNYSASYTWGISTSAGSVSFTGSPNIPNATYNFTVTGLSPGESATVTITTTRVGYNSGSATRTGSATTGAALTPTFGTNTRTSGGFSGSVTNYSSSYTWNISVSGGASVSFGTVSGSTYPFTVTGGTAGTSYTVTVTTTRNGYATGSGTTSASALSNLTTNPAYGTATSGSLSFTASINTSPNPTGGTYSVVSQTNGSASVNSSSGALSVTGLTLGQSSTVTVRYSLSGYNSVDITVTGSASSNVAPSGGSVSIALTSGTSGRVGAVYTATVTNASGTPTPTFTRQWRRTINYSPFTISNVGTNSATYTSTYDDVDSEITCIVTFTNGVSPDQVATSNGLSVSPPTITGITATTTNNTSPYCTWTIFGYNIQSSTGAVFYGTGTNPTTLSGTNPQANTGLTRATTSRTGTGANYYRYDNIRAFSGTGGTGRPSPSVSAIASTTVVRANAAQTTTVYGTV